MRIREEMINWLFDSVFRCNLLLFPIIRRQHYCCRSRFYFPLNIELSMISKCSKSCLHLGEPLVVSATWERFESTYKRHSVLSMHHAFTLFGVHLDIFPFIKGHHDFFTFTSPLTPYINWLFHQHLPLH